MKKYRKQYWKNNSEQLIKKHLEWQKNNPEKANKNNVKWQKNHPEWWKKYHNHKNNPEYHRQYMKYKRKTDLKCNLNHKISRGIYKSLKGNKQGRRWEKLVGYALNDLLKRLKRTMPKGYIWQDYLRGELHIDHIIPISVWNFNKPEHIDFKRCWALSNLQLLPAKDNLSKHNKITKPFQLALKI